MTWPNPAKENKNRRYLSQVKLPFPAMSDPTAIIDRIIFWISKRLGSGSLSPLRIGSSRHRFGWIGRGPWRHRCVHHTPIIGKYGRNWTGTLGWGTCDKWQLKHRTNRHRHFSSWKCRSMPTRPPAFRLPAFRLPACLPSVCLPPACQPARIGVSSLVE